MNFGGTATLVGGGNLVDERTRSPAPATKADMGVPYAPLVDEARAPPLLVLEVNSHTKSNRDGSSPEITTVERAKWVFDESRGRVNELEIADLMKQAALTSEEEGGPNSNTSAKKKTNAARSNSKPKDTKKQIAATNAALSKKIASPYQSPTSMGAVWNPSVSMLVTTKDKTMKEALDKTKNHTDKSRSPRTRSRSTIRMMERMLSYSRTNPNPTPWQHSNIKGATGSSPGGSDY